jgi:hypothetical protein
MVPLISTRSAFVAGGADAVCVRQDVERLRSRTARDKSALRHRAISVTGTPVVILILQLGDGITLDFLHGFFLEVALGLGSAFSAACRDTDFPFRLFAEQDCDCA